MGDFFRDAFRQAAALEWRVLALVLFALVTLTNMVVLAEMPEPGESPSPAFIVAAVVRIAGLLLISVALLRRATRSPRPAFLPDGAFWLATLLGILNFALAALVGMVLPGAGEGVAGLVAGNAIAALIMAPLAPWTVALATERPLAIDPRPRLRNFSAWLAPLIIGQLLVLVPLSALHAFIDYGMVEGTIARSLWLQIVDGAISVLIVLFGMALAVAAYRRVARG